MIAILAAIGVSLFIIGLPAAVLKALAGFFFATGQRGVVRASVGWGAVVGVATIVFHFAIVSGLASAPGARHFVVSMTGWVWTGFGLIVLAVAATVVDYFKVVRPLGSKIEPTDRVGFLMFSNAWVLGGGILLAAFNSTFLFQTCFDPAANRVVHPFSEPPPEICEEFDD